MDPDAPSPNPASQPPQPGAAVFGPADITAATRGKVTSYDLRNWVRDGRFNTPLAEPKAGKPRAYSMAAVREAALLAALSELGVPLGRAKAWLGSLLPRIAAGQAPEYIVWAPGARVPYLPPAGATTIDAAATVLGGASGDAPAALCILRVRPLLARLEADLK